jgi:hypothetical protein
MGNRNALLKGKAIPELAWVSVSAECPPLDKTNLRKHTTISYIDQSLSVLQWLRRSSLGAGLFAEYDVLARRIHQDDIFFVEFTGEYFLRQWIFDPVLDGAF